MRDRSRNNVFELSVLLWAILVQLMFTSATNSSESNPASLYLKERYPVFHLIAFSNSEYKFVEPLPSGKKDIDLIVKSFKNLKEKNDAFVTYEIHSDANNHEFESVLTFWNKLNKYTEGVKEGDVVIFYYSGHGFQFKGSDYLIPLDYPKDQIAANELFQHAIPLQSVLDKLAEKNKGLAILIMDACRTDQQFKILTPSGLGNVDYSYTELMPRKWDWSLTNGHAIAYATPSGTAAVGSNDETQGSIFTQAIADVMSANCAPDMDGSCVGFRYGNWFGAIGRKVADLGAKYNLSYTMKTVQVGDTLAFDFLPQPSVWQNFQRLWTAALESNGTDAIPAFRRQNLWSQYTSAAAQYLQDHAGNNAPIVLASDVRGPRPASNAGLASIAGKLEGTGFTSMNPVAVDRAYDAAGADNMAAIVVPNLPLRFPRTMSGLATLELSKLSSNELGIVVGDNQAQIYAAAKQILGQSEGLTGLYARQIGKFAEVTTDRPVAVKTEPNDTGLVLGTLPKTSTVRLIDPRLNNAGDLYARLDVPEDRNFSDGQRPIVFGNGEAGTGEYWIMFKADQSISQPQQYTKIIGRPLGETKVRKDDKLWPSILDTAPIEAALKQFKQDKRRLSWVSIATAPVGDECATSTRNLSDQQFLTEKDARTLNLALVGKLMRDSGLPSSQITVVPDCDLVGDDMRLRFFGF
jgi:hypothetical protein